MTDRHLDPAELATEHHRRARSKAGTAPAQAAEDPGSGDGRVRDALEA